MCFPQNVVVREVMPRRPSKRAQTCWGVSKDRGWEMHTTLITNHHPCATQKPRPGSWLWLKADSRLPLPYAIGSNSNVQVVLPLYFCRHTLDCKQKAFRLPTCKLHAKKWSQETHRDLKTICPPNSYTTRQKTHCWVPAFTMVFLHNTDASWILIRR